MSLHTIIINDRTNKTKHLLDLIKVMAKNEKNILIDPAKNLMLVSSKFRVRHSQQWI